MPKVLTSKIAVREGLERFRKDMGEIQELANSMQKHGQLQPIVVNKNYELIAGGRRLAACILYKMDIDVKVIDENDPLAMREIEVEENIQRKDFTPAEEVVAIQELHELKCAIQARDTDSDSRTGAKTNEWTIQDTADLVGKNRSTISRDLDLAAAVRAVPQLAKCKTKKELKLAVSTLEKMLTKADATAEVSAKVANCSDRVKLFNIPAIEFMEAIPDDSVDILLCDPQYGISITENSIGKGGETGKDNYVGYKFDDSENAFRNIIPSIANESFRFCNDIAHAYVFCAPEFFQAVRTYFYRAGWDVYIRPIIWIKPGQGQANNPDLWPVSNYEMCMYARRENSTLINARPDYIRCNRVSPSAKIHPTQKPLELLQELITRSVLPGATLVDPCMGSGSSLVAGLKENLIVSGTDIEKPAYEMAKHYVAETLGEL